MSILLRWMISESCLVNVEELKRINVSEVNSIQQTI